MAKRKIACSILVIVSLLVFCIPIMTKNHIYQGIADGGDTRLAFIPAIEQSMNGENLLTVIKSSLYPAIGLTMWLVGTVNRWLQLDAGMIFYIYSMVVLLASGISLYYLGKEFGGKRTGWITLIIGIFCSTSIMSLYSYACLANIMNVYIILMWATTLAIRWYKTKKWIYLIGSMMLVAIYSALHATAFYIPYAMGVLFVTLVVLAAKGKVKWKEILVPYTTVIVLAVAFNLIMSRYYLQNMFIIFASTIPDGLIAVMTDGASGIVGRITNTTGTFIQFLTPITIFIGLLTGIELVRRKLWKHLDNYQWLALLILGSFTIALVGGSVLKVISLPERIIIDASAFVALIIAFVLGELIKRKQMQWLTIATFILMGTGVMQALVRWVI